MNIGIGILISADSRYILNTQLNIRSVYIYCQ